RTWPRRNSTLATSSTRNKNGRPVSSGMRGAGGRPGSGTLVLATGSSFSASMLALPLARLWQLENRGNDTISDLPHVLTVLRIQCEMPFLAHQPEQKQQHR